MTTERLCSVMKRELALEFARVTEAAAIACARWWGGVVIAILRTVPR